MVTPRRLFVLIVLSLALFYTAERNSVFAQRSMIAKPSDTNSKSIEPRTPISRLLAVALIRSALAAVNHGNWTGNYTTLRDFASPSFAIANDPSRLSSIFSPLRGEQLDLLPAMVLDPILTIVAFTQDGKLRLTGYVQSMPRHISFDLLFEVVDGRWRMFGVGVEPMMPPTQKEGNLTAVPLTVSTPVVLPPQTKQLPGLIVPISRLRPARIGIPKFRPVN